MWESGHKSANWRWKQLAVPYQTLFRGSLHPVHPIPQPQPLTDVRGKASVYLPQPSPPAHLGICLHRPPQAARQVLILQPLLRRGMQGMNGVVTNVMPL